MNVRPYLSLVTIRGAVNAPTSVAYIPGKGIDYYINAAGGPTRTGDDDRAYPFHCTKIADGTREIPVGAAVEFTVAPGPLGRWEAVAIRRR